jgi:hypothetical protein
MIERKNVCFCIYIFNSFSSSIVASSLDDFFFSSTFFLSLDFIFSRSSFLVSVTMLRLISSFVFRFFFFDSFSSSDDALSLELFVSDFSSIFPVSITFLANRVGSPISCALLDLNLVDKLSNSSSSSSASSPNDNKPKFLYFLMKNKLFILKINPAFFHFISINYILPTLHPLQLFSLFRRLFVAKLVNFSVLCHQRDCK